MVDIKSKEVFIIIMENDNLILIISDFCSLSQHFKSNIDKININIKNIGIINIKEDLNFMTEIIMNTPLIILTKNKKNYHLYPSDYEHLNRFIIKYN